LLVEGADQRLLVDCGPDLRQQLLAADVDQLDAVIVTHAHGDHCHGIDELRPVAAAIGRPLPMYARRDVLDTLAQRFAYAFESSSFYKPMADAREVGNALTLGDLQIGTVDQPHGDISTLGLRFDRDGNSIGYAVDFNDLTDDMAKLYQGVDVWIADCLTRSPHPTHGDLSSLLGWARELEVGQLYLVHMGTGLVYRTLCQELPDWAAPGPDGLEIAL
jgi:phosphoribosyl 1,2-cyclic phosphate phosphodiesterase